jgi:hypothetical protein
VELLATVTALTALATAASPAAADQPAYAGLSGYRYCGKIPNPDTGGTTKIYGRRVSCRNSKSLWRLWRRHLDRLRCTRGNQRMRGYWGG